VKEIMGNIENEDIDVMFMKVDSNCDGSVVWVMLLSCIIRDKLALQKVFKHQVVLPSGTYQGMVFSSLQLDQTKRKHTHKMWVIDMVCLPNISLLAIASTERTIEFFDISGVKCDRVFYLAELEGCATALDYWTDGHKGVFCAGDAKGNVLIFTSLNVLANGLFNVRPYIIKPGAAARIPVQLLLKEKGSLYSSFRMPALHEDWCHQIKFIPELNLVASCSATDKGAMVLTALPLNNQGKPQSSAIALKKGILCFDYSPRMNVLVTGGLDPLIRIWNPYVTNSPITMMKGHVTAVTHVIVSGYRNTILSISKDKNIRIWDLLDHFCLQSIPSRSISLGNCPIIGVYYNELNNVLICTTTSVRCLYNVQNAQELDRKTACPSSWCSVQVVSGCYSGVVRVWDIMTGQKMMQFKASEGKQTEVTAMAFDGAERRLITGLKDGTIKFWNFNNGDCLLELPCLDKTEISGILYINRKIYVSGWSKRVHWKCYHSEDIFSMDTHNNKLLVTASCDGDVVIWNIDSGQAFCRFNASQSPLTLMPNRVSLRTFSAQAEARKKCWVDASPRLPTRPISAKHISSSSSGYWKAPASAPPGMRQPKGKEREEVLFLQTRERNPDTAILLTSSADGYVYAWSVGGKGGLLGKFRPALRDENAVVNAMATDSNDWILLTGDSLGYIKIWDIEHYCKPKVVKRVSKVGKMEASPKLLTCPRRSIFANKGYFIALQVLDGWVTSLVAPDLLSSWRGHLKNISHIVYVERLRLIVTASDDCNIKLWLLSGRHIGIIILLPFWLAAPRGAVVLQRRCSPPLMSLCTRRTQSLMQSTGHLKKQQSALMEYLREKAGLSLGTQKTGGETSLKEKRIIDQVEATWQKWEKTEKMVRSSVVVSQAVCKGQCGGGWGN
uniref:WD repeat-containing protein on Y chromosome n=1 Tax=Crocodylus porosus TaxID=8502 RepID=A0A7M4EKC8_CROPO